MSTVSRCIPRFPADFSQPPADSRRCPTLCCCHCTVPGIRYQVLESPRHSTVSHRLATVYPTNRTEPGTGLNTVFHGVPQNYYGVLRCNGLPPYLAVSHRAPTLFPRISRYPAVVPWHNPRYPTDLSQHPTNSPRYPIICCCYCAVCGIRYWTFHGTISHKFTTASHEYYGYKYWNKNGIPRYPTVSHRIITVFHGVNDARYLVRDFPQYSTLFHKLPTVRYHVPGTRLYSDSSPYPTKVCCCYCVTASAVANLP